MANNNNHRFRLFVGCIVSLVATAFGFAVRGQLLDDWGLIFDLSNEQKGYIQGVGLYPFAISIILFSFVVDRIGYGVSMAIAFTLHVLSAVLTLCAPLALAGEGASPEAVQAGQQFGFVILYIGTFCFALGNGAVEAVVNPAVATMYPNEKTKYLSILHAGWPGGLVLGGLFGIAMGNIGDDLSSALPGSLWQWRIGLMILPMLAYGAILVGQKFPVHERVEAGVSYYDMLREFGWASALIVLFLLVAAFNQILVVVGVPTSSPLIWLGIAVVLTIPFALYVKSFGKPMFVILLLIMCLVGTTELGGDSWMQDIIGAVTTETQAAFFFAWMALIMFVLRFFAGPIVRAVSPLGLLAISAAVACGGLLWLAGSPKSALIIFFAATLYGLGKTFFWPTMLGVTSEQYPKGGALMINAIAGVGMIFVGSIGNPSIGTVQDQEFLAKMDKKHPELVEKVVTEQKGLWFNYESLNQNRLSELPKEDQEKVTAVVTSAKQVTLGWLAILPGVMLLAYLGLIVYFRAKGGYRAQELTGRPQDTTAYSEAAEGPAEL